MKDGRGLENGKAREMALKRVSEKALHTVKPEDERQTWRQRAGQA